MPNSQVGIDILVSFQTWGWKHAIFERYIFMELNMSIPLPSQQGISVKSFTEGIFNKGTIRCSFSKFSLGDTT